MNEDYEILLVEDDPDDAELTLLALRQKNGQCKVCHVRDGAEALDFIFSKGRFTGRSSALFPRFVLLDINLPKLCGIEVLKTIRKDARRRSIPVVMLTSSRERRDVMATYELGANSYIVKPLGFEEYMKVIGEMGLYWLSHNQVP